MLKQEDWALKAVIEECFRKKDHFLSCESEYLKSFFS